MQCLRQDGHQVPLGQGVRKVAARQGWPPAAAAETSMPVDPGPTAREQAVGSITERFSLSNLNKEIMYVVKTGSSLSPTYPSALMQLLDCKLSCLQPLRSHLTLVETTTTMVSSVHSPVY